MFNFRHITVTASALLLATHVYAQQSPPDPKNLISGEVIAAIHKWIDVEIVRVSIKAQNKRLGRLAQDKIDALDKQWIKERVIEDQPLIAATLSNPLSVYLNRIQGKSLGLYAEIFVMDQNGLNVGQSSITTDFWQGDEDKFQQTYDIGPDAVFIDKAEWDKENRIWRAQVSFTLKDADAKTKIGAVTVELNLTELRRRTEPDS